MNQQVIFCVVIVLICFTQVSSCAEITNKSGSTSSQYDQTTPPPVSSSSSATSSTEQMDFNEIMKKCNESFRISTDYLAELNTTGSFPDETDKTTMCYLKCFLEQAAIINANGTINKDNGAFQLLWPNSADIIDDCVNAQAGLFDKDNYAQCEFAYYLVRCTMTNELVASRKSDVML